MGDADISFLMTERWGRIVTRLQSNPVTAHEVNGRIGRIQMKKYSLDFVRSFDDEGCSRDIGDISSRHDISLGKWEMSVRLTDNGLGVADWFLSVFINDDDSFDTYSLDYIDAYADFHYEFIDEESIRKKLYKDGDENLCFHEIIVRFCNENGGQAFYEEIKEYITSHFHYVDSDYYDD